MGQTLEMSAHLAQAVWQYRWVFALRRLVNGRFGITVWHNYRDRIELIGIHKALGKAIDTQRHFVVTADVPLNINVLCRVVAIEHKSDIDPNSNALRTDFTHRQAVLTNADIIQRREGDALKICSTDINQHSGKLAQIRRANEEAHTTLC